MPGRGTPALIETVARKRTREAAFGLYEAQWEKRQQASADGRWSAVAVPERLAVGDAE